MAVKFLLRDVSGDYKKPTRAESSIKDKCIYIKIGGFNFLFIRFIKPKTFKVPHDLIPGSFNYEFEERKEFSVGKALAKTALGVAAMSRGSKSGFVGGFIGGSIGKALVESDSSTTTTDVRINFQFNDKTILSAKLSPYEWKEFHKYYCCFDYNNYAHEQQTLINNIEQELTTMREQYSSADAKKQKEITEYMGRLKNGLNQEQKKFQEVTKLAKKARIISS